MVDLLTKAKKVENCARNVDKKLRAQQVVLDEKKRVATAEARRLESRADDAEAKAEFHPSNKTLGRLAVAARAKVTISQVTTRDVA